ncbi:MAG: NAD(+) synthase [Oscillospiraceae bacterium]|jgi:NAD+ synthase (glutamine-hydrolysing)|nr:NAD(+) synthase [Oscillospiraceae bacterium]
MTDRHTSTENYSPAQTYLRVASACPEVAVYNPFGNTERITELYETAAEKGASLVVFPELSVTGYSLGDLVTRTALLRDTRLALLKLSAVTLNKNCAMVVGLPLTQTDLNAAPSDNIYNCAALLADGEVKGVVAKSHLPSYDEFYENRWFVPAESNNLLFEIDGALIGIEICEDAWVSSPPSETLAAMGANIIVNLSASPEKIGMAQYRRDLVKTLSSRLIAGYVYAGCDSSESTSEVVMGGHQLISANGQILAEKQPFGAQRLMFADIDLEHLAFDRRKRRFGSSDLRKPGNTATVIRTNIKRVQTDILAKIDRNPFLPEESTNNRANRIEELLSIQTEGLYRRMKKTGLGSVLGLSGGLDSTLAVLIMVRAAKKIGGNLSDKVHTLIMPGPASSGQTQSNAAKLAQGLGVTCLVSPIAESVTAELNALSHDSADQNVTYENVQARLRTLRLFNYANEHGLMVINTSDMSEAALGWSTYGGDQTGNYGVNCGLPKTVVREAIRYLSGQEEYAAVKTVLLDVIDTPISPELTTSGNGITQLTEDKIGPYALHDFFLYYFVRRGDSPEKIAYLAKYAFAGEYSGETVDKWLGEFLRRFTRNQFKRDTMPNGPKVGAVALSPRGDWRMPSDV